MTLVVTHSLPKAAIKPKTSCFNKKCKAKIIKVALHVLFALTCALFMAIQAPFFFIGVIFGVTLPAKMQEMVSKIKDIWKKHPWASLGLTILATGLAFPVVFMAGALFTGADLAVRLVNWKN